MDTSQNITRAALGRVILKVSGQAELARQVAATTGRPIKTGHVYYWLKEGAVPADCCQAIAAIGGELATLQQLRPEDYWLIWPELKAPVESAQEA